MADIINLRRARKHKARETAETAAAANRTRHGISKKSRDTAKAGAAKDQRELDAHRLALDDDRNG